MSKIMQINITCGVGSTGKLAVALYEASIADGFEARFAYSTFSPTIKTAFPIENKFQNYLRRGLNKFLGNRQSHSTPGTRRLIRYIKREKPDLIHLHNVQQNSVNFILLFSFLKKSNIPVVYTLHDCWAFTGGCYHFTERCCLGYQSDCLDCPCSSRFDDIGMTDSRKWQYKSELIGQNDNIHIVCVSEWLKNCASSSYMKHMTHCVTRIYNGIDTAVFSPSSSGRIKEKLGLPTDIHIILGVASFWTREKGLGIFEYLADNLDNLFKIVLIGQFPKNYSNCNIISVQRTENQHELAEYYSAADAFVNTSLEETFGMTTAEAMACGTPCIVFQSTACPEIVDDKTGLCVAVSQESKKKLLEAILYICENGKAKYKANCVKRVQENFSKSAMNDNYLSLYRGILNAKQSNSSEF